MLMTSMLIAASARYNVSNVFGDHMVLQRAPDSARIWGFGHAGAEVTTNFRGKAWTTTVGKDGVWRQVRHRQAHTSYVAAVRLYQCSPL